MTVARSGRATLTRADDEGHLRPAVERGLGDGDAHLARGSVADEADRIDRLGGAAGGDDDVPAGEVRLADGGATAGGRAAGSGARIGRSATAATTASTIARQRRQGGPTPTWPEARGPTSGSTIA